MQKTGIFRFPRLALAMERILSRLSAWRRDRRRASNLRAGGRCRAAPAFSLPAGAGFALAAAAVAVAAAGAFVLWRHAERLAAQDGVGPAPLLSALQPAFAGLRFVVPEGAGVSVQQAPGGSLLVVGGMLPGPALRVDLCARPLPLQVGYRFSEVEGEPALRHALLVAEGSKVPAMTISAASDVLRVRWRERGSAARWNGDAAGAAMRTLGWLTWREGAVRVERRPGKACPQGGIVVQLFSFAGTPARGAPGGGILRPAAGASALPTPAAAGRAHVVAFPAGGAPVALRLAPGRYEVPLHAAAVREDEVLFRQLLARGLLRVGGDGLLELAPPDLAQWLVAGQGMRAADLAGWRDQRPDEEMRKLLKRLYRQADGEFVRRQVDLFNSERRLLAWRLGDGAAPGTDVSIRPPGGGELGQTAEMPPLAVRLFSDLPQGWQAWSRAAHWLGREGASLVVQLPHPARGGERIELLLAGELSTPATATAFAAGGAPSAGAAGAMPASAVAAAADACFGPACRRTSDVQKITLRPEPGAMYVVLPVRALDVSRALHPGDQAYRHIALAGGMPVWRAGAAGATGAMAATGVAATTRSAAASSRAAAYMPSLQIADRDGAPLWSGNAPTPAAREGGMATLLGVGPAHISSLSGMLARAAAIEGRPSAARLSISLPLQALGQAILECQGLRGGRWRAERCENGVEPPPQRRAGLVLLDADNGDILLAAGAGAPTVTPDNWREARDFDRANPARSALRLPAWQHDGGAHSSPGSAFKMISALGLEMAARRDRTLDSLLGGLPLQEIDQLARQRGYAFRTDAPSYPAATSAAHVTNYREQSLSRRAEAGRLGLAQAMTYSVNTWFAWTAELSDRTLRGQAEGGAPGLRALEDGALAAQRPISEAARTLGFGSAMRLDGGLLPQDFPWQAYDALQASAARIDPIDSRHELRQMAIGLRMQATPLQMAVAAAAIGSGTVPVPRLLLGLGGREARVASGTPLPVRLDRIRAGMKGVVDSGTAAGAFSDPALAVLRRGLYGKTGTAPVSDEDATVWFSGWLEAGSMPGQQRRLAFAAFVSHSQLTGGGHAAPIVAALLKAMAGQSGEQKGISPSIAANGRGAAMPR